MNSLQLIRRLFEHKHWMIGNLLATAEALAPDQLQRPFQMGPGSAFGVLFHLYRADHLWLAALNGDPTAAEPPPAATMPDLQREWRALVRRWQTFLDGLAEADLDRRVERRPPKTDVVIATPMADVLLHVATHASYHAAQFNNMARHVGVPRQPDVMLITLARQQATTP